MRHRKDRDPSAASHKDSSFELELGEGVRDFLSRSTNPDDEWLWCLYCERFFQARFLRMDYQSNLEGCAFCKCAGFDCAIFRWNTFRNDAEPWPDSEVELHHGLRLHAIDR